MADGVETAHRDSLHAESAPVARPDNALGLG